MVKKGIVMKADKKWATVLTPDGEFCYVPNRGQGFVEGKEIFFSLEYENQSFVRFPWLNWKVWKEWSATAAVLVMLMLLLIPLVQGWLSPQVSAYVTLDINPSVEIGINEEYQVLSVDALNPDGEEILSQIEWKGKSLAAVTTILTNKSEELGYLNTNRDVLITTTALNDNPDFIENISSQIEQGFVNRSSLKVVYIESNNEYREEAKKAGISPGKYMVWKAVDKSGKPMTIDQINGKSITQLQQEIGDIGQLLSILSEQTNQTEATIANQQNIKDNKQNKNNNQLNDDVKKNEQQQISPNTQKVQPAKTDAVEMDTNSDMEKSSILDMILFITKQESINTNDQKEDDDKHNKKNNKSKKEKDREREKEKEQEQNKREHDDDEKDDWVNKR